MRTRGTDRFSEELMALHNDSTKAFQTPLASLPCPSGTVPCPTGRTREVSSSVIIRTTRWGNQPKLGHMHLGSSPAAVNPYDTEKTGTGLTFLIRLNPKGKRYLSSLPCLSKPFKFFPDLTQSAVVHCHILAKKYLLGNAQQPQVCQLLNAY